MRHAKSSWQDGNQPDRERPLSGRGERDAPAMARRLRARGTMPALILTSHAARAASTARIVAAILGCDPAAVRVEPTLYLASADAILTVVAAQNDRLAELLIVGHNPGLTHLANHLLPELALDNLPTAGVVAIGSDAEHWTDLGRAGRRLLHYDYPKNPDAADAPSRGH